MMGLSAQKRADYYQDHVMLFRSLKIAQHGSDRKYIFKMTSGELCFLFTGM